MHINKINLAHDLPGIHHINVKQCKTLVVARGGWDGPLAFSYPSKDDYSNLE